MRARAECSAFCAEVSFCRLGGGGARGGTLAFFGAELLEQRGEIEEPEQAKEDAFGGADGERREEVRGCRRNIA